MLIERYLRERMRYLKSMDENNHEINFSSPGALHASAVPRENDHLNAVNLNDPSFRHDAIHDLRIWNYDGYDDG